jgi:hypothetical protein
MISLPRPAAASFPRDCGQFPVDVVEYRGQAQEVIFVQLLHLGRTFELDFLVFEGKEVEDVVEENDVVPDSFEDIGVEFPSE